jgi:NADPH-dependent 7-cyano-7-deazaguanine reductase QueF
MFKPKAREARVRFVKVDENEDVPTEKKKIFTEDAVNLITERGKDAVKFLAIAVVGAYAAVKTIDTVSQIAVKKTKSADNK